MTLFIIPSEDAARACVQCVRATEFQAPWQRLYFFPDPQEHASLRLGSLIPKGFDTASGLWECTEAGPVKVCSSGFLN